ncbi:DUF4136 domain-containing protein [Rufibacter latericius]|uniref:DUF4136 domain-containing protein n=1 Tax=Rufibacter latericius TaxID=2487040 RepID=A0A3M9MYQ3_9BACT|nr:DUF4136 domain-containing protein [Rufibacter latericius]RNI30682.1 DUF4136 domain-containing protein [Rufibacter latericius]
MKKNRWIPLAILLAIILNACSSSIKVMNTQAAPDFNLTSYKTFGFAQDNALAVGDSIEIPAEHLALFQREVSRQLEQRGLTQTSTNPDLLVNLGIVVAEKTQTRQTDFRTDAPYYSGQRRYSWKSKEVEVGRYKEGTISVHLVNNAQNALVWSSEAEAVVPRKAEKVQEKITEGVEKLFSSLLPTAK